MITVHLYTYDGQFYRDISQLVSQYSHELTKFGPSRAEFTVKHNSNSELHELYLSMLMMHIKMFFDGVRRWEGYVWELKLSTGVFERTRSMTDVRNKVKIGQTNDNDPSFKNYTAWQEDEGSQAIYGPHEYIEVIQGKAAIVWGTDGEPKKNLDGSLAWEFDVAAQEQLTSYAYPMDVFSGGEVIGEPSLTVRCVGRSMIANHMKLSDGWLTDGTTIADGTNLRDDGTDSGLAYGASTTVSKEIKRIVGVVETNGGWLYEIDIDQSNTIKTVAGVASSVGSVDRLRELARLPDGYGNKYELIVRQDGGVEYRRRQTEPHFLLYPDGWKMLDGSDISWRAYVAPIRIVDRKLSYVDRDWFEPERVNVSADGVARFSNTLDITDADIAADIRENMLYIKSMEEKMKGK